MTELLEKKVGDLSPEELEQLLKEKKEAKKKAEAKRRAEYEKNRDEMTKHLVMGAKSLNGLLAEFKRDSFEKLDAFYAKMKEYGYINKDNKGSFSLETAEGDFKVEYKHQVVKKFDERAEMASAHIQAFLEKMVKKRDQATYELVMGLIQKTGKDETFDPRLIGRLWKMEDKFDDENWVKGIALFKEAYTESSTSDYLRFFEKNKTGGWDCVQLNFASI